MQCLVQVWLYMEVGRLHNCVDGNGSVVIETVVDVWPGNNENFNVMGTMGMENVCVLDGYRFGGMRLY